MVRVGWESSPGRLDLAAEAGRVDAAGAAQVFQHALRQRQRVRPAGEAGRGSEFDWFLTAARSIAIAPPHARPTRALGYYA